MCVSSIGTKKKTKYDDASLPWLGAGKKKAMRRRKGKVCSLA